MNAGRRPRAAVFALVAVGLLTAAGSASADNAVSNSSAKGPDPQLIERLKAKARGSVTISTKRSTEHVGFIRVGRNGDLHPGGGRSAEGKAQSFLAEYGALFGADGASKLERAATSTDRQGAVHLTYRQSYKGVPVFGGVVKVHVDAGGNLTAANGVAAPELDLDVTPGLSAAQAADRAIAAVVNDPPRNEDGSVSSGFLTAGDLTAVSTTLYVYRMGLVRSVPGESQLVYEVEVTNRADVRDFVYIHANAGKVVNRYSAIHDALFRRLFERSTATQVWQEGDPFPGTLNVDQQNIVSYSGDTYYHFFNAFGRDSYDALGHELQSVNNDPRINCPNANWNGLTTNYCNGVTADDVVAHEWGHAYTQYTHNLIYQWQPGALNEGYSDIWGELVDLINNKGTDSPGGVRTVGSCSSFTRPLPALFINSPPSIAGECTAAGANFGPPLTAAGTTGDVVLANDGVGVTTDACTALPAGQASGKIALVDRGTCGFVVKVKIAQDAGAIGVVVANNAPTAPFTMGGADPTITIPSVMISQANGNLIKGELPNGPVNVTMKDKGGSREASYRWLEGEDATAFGGAIRDLWNPNCLGDPGKVSDAEYHCDPSDGGGVHTNSGVPNHGFALLVDGGTYNGQTVAALGMVKAAHIYWRAQSVYQTQTSDFTDHADALEASCADLVGVPLLGLSTTSTPAGPSGQAITAGDCAAVSAMAAAVELRTEPTQCNFQPLLRQNPPALCPNQKNPPVVFEENFEDGLAGWTLENQGVFSGWTNLNWQASSTLPGGRSGTAAFAPDPDAGNCDGGAGDISGRMTLTSPAIKLPNAAILHPRLIFQHYVATEFQFDGGNVRVSVNGGSYELVPATAFLFNPYNTTLQPTNPLAGQPGFSGTDGGQVTGSWGESQVNLEALGIKPGDTIQLRFNFGIDGCAGVDGWYVDDVKVRACNEKKDRPRL